MRVYEFAREFDKLSGDFLQELKSEFGFEIKSHLSKISEEQMEQVRLAYNLEIQIDDSHKEDVEKTFNTTEEKTDKWTLGSGDAKKEPEFISYGLIKDNEELKKIEEEEPESLSIDDLILDEKKGINPDLLMKAKQIEEIVKQNEKAVQSSVKTAEHARKEYAKTVHNITENPDDWHIVTSKEDASSLVLENLSEKKQQEIIIEKPSWCYRMLGWLLGN